MYNNFDRQGKGGHMSRYNTRTSPKVGDIYMMEFYGQGSAQDGFRPGLVVQNNIGNKMSPNVVALPLTSGLKNMHQPTHVFLPAAETGLRADSIVLCESPMSIPKSKIKSFKARLSKHYMREVAKAFLLEHPVLCFLSLQEMTDVQQEAYSLIAE